MALRPVARSEPIAGFVPALELLIAEAMDEWKIPVLAVAVVQNGKVALVRAYGLRDVEAGLRVTLAASGKRAQSRRYHATANLLTKHL
jgi:CubicO group peptidase (beta-lactamase class C family)